MTNGHSCCFDCERVVTCKKKYRHKRTPSTLYPGTSYISECVGFTPMESEIVTVDQIGELCGISKRSVYRFLSMGIEYAMTRFASLSGKCFEYVKPTKERRRACFRIASEGVERFAEPRGKKRARAHARESEALALHDALLKRSDELMWDLDKDEEGDE